MIRMFVEILAFIFTISRWVLVSSTLPTDYWKVATLVGVVVTTVANFSNLWNTCVSDFMGVSDCKDFPSMLALDGYIQACRALMIAAICLGFFGSTFALVGMKCTKIGETDKSKARIACFAGVTFILSVLVCKYDLGAALFIGWSGSIFCILGGSILCFSIAGSFTRTKSHSQANYIYNGAASHSHISSYPRGQAKSVNQRPPPDYSNSSRMQHFDKNAYV